MSRISLIATLLLSLIGATRAELVELNKKTYKPGKAVLTMSMNWGRTWTCGQYENAQIHSLIFRRTPLNDESVYLELKTPSKLRVENKFIPYAFVIEPGEYVLAGFDVKVARSVKDVGHLRGTEADLLKDGASIGGKFVANADEVVYIGHFGLDCGAKPFLWRYYLENQEEFQGWVELFKGMGPALKYPFVKALPARFSLFDTTMLGYPFSIPNPVIE